MTEEGTDHLKWLKSKLDAHRGLKAEVARNTSLSQPQLSKILAGERQIKLHEFEELKEFFGEKPLDLIEEEIDLIVKLRKLPVDTRNAVYALVGNLREDNDV